MQVCFVCGESIEQQGDGGIASVRVKLDNVWVTRFIHSPSVKAECWNQFAHWRNYQIAKEDELRRNAAELVRELEERTEASGVNRVTSDRIG